MDKSKDFKDGFDKIRADLASLSGLMGAFMFCVWILISFLVVVYYQVLFLVFLTQKVGFL